MDNKKTFTTSIVISLLFVFMTVAVVIKTAPSLKNKIFEYVTSQFGVCLSDAVDRTGQCDDPKIKRFLKVYDFGREYIDHRADLSGLVGFAYARTGQLSKARQHYQQALMSWPDFFWFHYNLGLIYYREGSYDEALEHFKKALSADPTKTSALTRSSNLYTKIMVTKLVRSNSTLDDFYLSAQRNIFILMALSFYQTKSFNEMFHVASYVLSSHVQKKEDFVCYEAAAANGLKKYDEAIALWVSCLKHRPEIVEAYLSMGLAFQALHREEEARRWKEMASQKSVSLTDIKDIELAPF